MWWHGIQYEKLELLGEGSQGQVFKALRRDRQTNLSQIVALKILHSENAVELWKREFESLRQVRSVQCVQVLAFDRIDGRPALVMEYVEGSSLLQLAQEKSFLLEDVTEVIAQTEAALKDLAAIGLCHGDLSPANILIDHQGTIKLLDFGLANFGGPEARLTPDFAAPERLNGATPNLLSDLYSLGCIESFLSGHPIGNSGVRNYLALNPSDRHLHNLRSQPELKARLAERVFAHKTQVKWSRTYTTRSLNDSPPKTIKEPRFAAVVAGLCLFLSSSTALSTNMPSAWATLIVRTVKWHLIEINGQKVGYAPLTIAIPAEKSLTLSWSRANGEGRKTLRAEAGQRMVISDRDFTP